MSETKKKCPGDNTIETAAFMLAKACHARAFNNGWWHNKDGSPRNLDPSTPRGRLELAWPLTLIHSEVSEAAEGLRKQRRDDHLPHRWQFEAEMADIVIRVMDLCGGLNIDIGAVIVEKLNFNDTRADHKPEARAAVGGKEF